MKNPLVSIVVITYNSSKYILETLESCKAQTYRNIELIISDDCSTDDTIQICRGWLKANAERFSDVKVLELNKNTGVAGNLNRGVAASRGIWFKFVAGDDLLYSHCISYNMQLLDRMPSDCCIINTVKDVFKVEDGEKLITNPKGRKERRRIFFKEGISAEHQLQLAVRFIRPSVNGHFIKKKMYIDIGGCDEKHPMHEDRPLLIRILSNGYKIYGSDNATVMYRIHGESIFNSGRDQLYTNWFYKSNIPVIKDYYFCYFTRLEKISYNYSFAVAKLFKVLHINSANYLCKAAHRLFLLPFLAVKKYFQYRTIMKIKIIR